MKKTGFILLYFIFFMCTAIFAAPKITMKLASTMPEATDWGRALNKMARQWSEATNGEVVLQIYHGGVMGSEGEMLQKLQGGALQGAVFSSAGLSLISEKVLTVSTPFLIQNENELDYVLKNMGGQLEGLIYDRGFQMVAWSKIGWIKFFGKDPIYTPSDLRKQKIAAGNELASINDVLKMLGYNVITIDYNNILTSLNSGTTNAIYHIPVFVAAQQLFGITKNMCSVNVAPVLGGIVFSQSGWRRIPEKYRAKLLETGRNIGTENDAAAAKLEGVALDTMKRYGLIVNEADAAQKTEWEQEAQNAMPRLTGGSKPIFDIAIYNNISNLLKTYRQGQ
jgi:TRAP-type C4-dicarboxylate transport system substrate-binding protein